MPEAAVPVMALRFNPCAKFMPEVICYLCVLVYYWCWKFLNAILFGLLRI